MKRFIKYVLLIGILGVLGFYGYRLFFLKDFAAQSKDQIYAQLEEARSALKNFDPEGAQESFTAISAELDNVQSEASKFGILGLTRFFEKFKAVPDMLRDLSGISGTAVHISEDVSYLKENGATLMLNGQGQEFIVRLGVFQEKLVTLTDYIDSLGKNTEALDEATLKKLGQLKKDIESTQKALAALIAFLNADKPQHLLVIFQNPTEQRPAGGFIGSFAVITIDKANITDISVRDIYDPDGQLDVKVVAPKTLQLITKDWEARDANWFFDFPTSARKVMYFLDNSKIYSERGIVFAGAIAVNTKVLEDVIGLIGPIDLPEYKTVIDKENFLTFVQKEVESGADKKVNQPKKILQVLTPKIMENISNLSGQGKQDLVRLLERHISHKNIMAYFADKELEGYVKSAGAAGEVYNPTNRAVTEYLAVVNANIAGGKTDAFVDQHIDLQSSIDAQGQILNTLTIIRSNNGEDQKEWWYKTTNKDYMQIYTTVGSQAISSTGRDLWPTPPKQTYSSKYLTDLDVQSIESTAVFLEKLGLNRFIAFDKTVFAAWLNTPPGKEKTFTLTYKNPQSMDLTGKLPYDFTFENQSGASTTLSLTVDAPPGYKWKESNSANISFQSDDPHGRVRIRQTLVPIQ